MTFSVADFIDEIAQAATMEGQARGIALRVMPVDEDLAVEADRQVLMAVVMNLLQNAFKFTRVNTPVLLSVSTSVSAVSYTVSLTTPTVIVWLATPTPNVSVPVPLAE